MRKDPRGPVRFATEVVESPTGGMTLVTLSCGHVREFANHFHYCVGSEQRCSACKE